MSDEQPPEVGSRRRRREIREARERARAAERERQSAVRRLSTSSSASDSSAVFDQESKETQVSPAVKRQAERESSDLGFESRRERRLRRTAQQPAVSPESPEPPRSVGSAASEDPDPKPVEPETATEQQRGGGEEDHAVEPETTTVPIAPATPFDDVVNGSPASPAPVPTVEYPEDAYLEHPVDYSDVDFDELDGHLEHDEDGNPVLVSASDYGHGYQTVQPVTGEMAQNILQKRRAKRRRRNITLTLAIGGFIVMVAVVWVFVQSLAGIFSDDGPENYEEIAGDTVEFEIQDGDGVEIVGNRLVSQGIVASSEAFYDAIQDQFSEMPTVHPGTFELHEQMPAEDAVMAIFDESVAQYYVAIEPNAWVDEVLEEIASSTSASSQELAELSEDPQQFGVPEEAEDLEGYIASGLYEIPLETPAEEIIQMMVDPTLEILEDQGVTDSEEQHRAIIIASLITAEGMPDDYSVIAGAIENRLQDQDGETSGYLQIDAAVNYGRGVRHVHFSEEDRADSSNEYNTYQHTGLTPGPIGAPDARAIAAAADPDDNDFLYWVTVDLSTGETRFAPTYAEHLENVELFNQYCEEDPDGLCGSEIAGGQTDPDEPDE